MKVAVIGAGKMGLPIACQLAGAGAAVQACDVSAPLVATINRGESPFEEPGLADLLHSAVRNGTLTATTDVSEAVAASDVVIVIVPVLLSADSQADLRHIHTVARQVGSSLRKGCLVIFETTMPVGSTRTLIPLLEAGGRRAGLDFDLVYSPERVKSRFVLKSLSAIPKVLGGLTNDAAARAANFYRQYLGAPIIDVGSLEAAEFTKLAGMVYRDVNIALANELARYADAVGIDFGSIAAAANTDGEAALLKPGIGVGGHCTPIYPYFLTHDAARRGVRAKLTELGRRVNVEQPEEAVSRLLAVWGPVVGRRVMILGLGFRPDVKEHTCSPAFQIRDAFDRHGAQVELCDPLYTADEIHAHGFAPGRLNAAPAPEAIVLATAHRAFADLDWGGLVASGLKVVVDGRNAWDQATLQQAGLIYLGVGRGVHLPASAEVLQP